MHYRLAPYRTRMAQERQPHHFIPRPMRINLTKSCARANLFSL